MRKTKVASVYPVAFAGGLKYEGPKCVNGKAVDWHVTWDPRRYVGSKTVYYHTSNSCECMGVNGEALQLHSVYKKPYFFTAKSHDNPYQYYKSRENLYQVLQVTRAASERAMNRRFV